MTTIEDFAAAGAGVGGESYCLSPWDVLSMADIAGGADTSPNDDDILSFAMGRGLVINDHDAIRVFLAGAADKIPGFERLLFDAEQDGREAHLGAYALGFNEMLPSRNWSPLAFTTDKDGLIAGGMIGLHASNSAAPVVLLANGASGVSLYNNLKRLGLLQAFVHHRPELTETARNNLAKINTKRPPKKPPRVWAKFD
ncbi:MAG: hypothetical protein ACU0AU_06775 [Cognatishimia activa]